eukprot:NODE_41_length_34096_cov_2.002235.p24 type:complete len:161 gc:universal NODE_41_length_34096_cov_2.002235:4715-4233(-)
MERILKSQLNNLGSSAKNAEGGAPNWQLDMALKAKKNWEINPYHPVVKGLLEKAIYLEDTFDDSQPESVNRARERDILRVAALLYDSISVRSGYGLRDPLRFGKRLDKILAKELGVATDAADTPVVKTQPKSAKEVKDSIKTNKKAEEDEEVEISAEDEL